jgi:hypothetical protein
MVKPPRLPKLLPSQVKLGFDSETITLTVDQIIPIKVVSPAALASRKFQQIFASIREVGIIEPPVVARDGKARGRYILLDGHLRLEALKQLKETDVTCLVSTDDEAFTYNKHISRLSIIQEHRMIVRAVQRGVPEAKIAQALDLDVSSIVHKRNLLEGICEEAVELLKDKIVATAVFAMLRRMKPLRQIEAATLMNDARVWSRSYMSAILAATPANQMLDPAKPKKIKGFDEEQMARMQSEMTSLQGEYDLIEETYRDDMMNLMLAKGYLAKLLGNVRVVRYLAQNHSEMLGQFQKIADMRSLNVQEAAE